MPEPYTPRAPTSTGTDDYRCFLLDPELTEPAFVTGVDIVPGRADLVHHVIIFRVSPGEVAAARATDAAEPGEGWTCFGGTGVESRLGGDLDAAPWLGAWAPGGGESILAPDLGVPMPAHSQVIMQVHYNLRAGAGADLSTARFRVAPGDADLAPLETMLLAAPIELPCLPDHDDGPLCDRDAAINDVIGRFGAQAGWTVSGLQLLCGGDKGPLKPSPVQHCDRVVRSAATVRAVAGHLHLLGRSITIELNPGQPDARTLLDIPVWNFDDQAATALQRPARLAAGDVLRVTCRHDQRLHELLPSFEGQPQRYVVWGEGTSDEMCLGIVMVTRR